MLIIPAVDLRSNEIVRLYKGDFSKVVRYAASVQDVVRDYMLAGIKRLHVVFLWGAHTGKLEMEEDALRQIAEIRNMYSPECRIQLGGGIRKSGQVEKFAGMGVDFFIIGTSILLPLAMKEGFTKNDIKLFYQRGGKEFREDIELPEPDMMERLDSRLKEKIMVAIDYRKDETALSGWEVSVPLTPHYMIGKLLEQGYRRFIITNVDRDGTLDGIDVKSTETILNKVSHCKEKPLEIIISGGVTTESDINALRTLKNRPDGVIIGKALYQKKLDIRSLIRVFQDN